MSETGQESSIKFRLIDNYLIALSEVSFLNVDDNIIELSDKGYVVGKDSKPFFQDDKNSFAAIHLTEAGKTAAQGLIDLKKL